MKKLSCMLLTLLLLSCASDAEQKEEDLKKEIMDIHDELMPKMDNIDTLKKKLQDNRGYLTSDSITSGDPQLRAADLDSLVQALENADESMMSWMRNYSRFDDPEFSHEEQMEYLQKEKEKIETVRLKVISSIKEAESILETDIMPVEQGN